MRRVTIENCIDTLNGIGISRRHYPGIELVLIGRPVDTAKPDRERAFPALPVCFAEDLLDRDHVAGDARFREIACDNMQAEGNLEKKFLLPRSF